MSLFNKNRQQERSIEDILTPKSENEAEIVEETEESADFSNEINETVETPCEIEKSTIQPINPTKFFGMSEGKTEKWLIKCVKLWHYIISFMWFLFGALTFAPIAFISDKVNVIFNKKKKSLLCALIIYGLFVALVVTLLFMRIETPAVETPINPVQPEVVTEVPVTEMPIT